MSNEKGRKSGNKALAGMVVIFLVILLPLTSLAIGFFGVQFMMNREPKVEQAEVQKSSKVLLQEKTQEESVVETPVKVEESETPTSEQASETAETSEVQTYTLPELHLYGIQVGSYGEPSNANKKALTCEQEGYGAIVHRMDNYKVMVMAFTSRDQAEVNQVLAAQSFEGAYITEVSVQAGTLEYTQADESYIHYLKQDIEMIQKLHESYLTYIHTYGLTDFDPNAFSVFLIGQHKEITKLKERIMAYEVSSQLKDQHGALITYVERMENFYTYLINLDNPTLKDIWDQTLDLLFDYKDLA